MKIAIVSGSHRKNSKSRMVAEWVAKEITAQDMEPHIMDLAEMDMPFWSENHWNAESAESKSWQPNGEKLAASDGLIIVSPEWAGMIPPKLTNFFLLCGKQELAYKPTLLIGVSAGMSGTYPIAQLRMNASKNNQMVYLPDHLIVRQVGQEGALERLEARLKFNIDVLKKLAWSLREVRQSLDVKAYPYGL